MHVRVTRGRFDPARAQDVQAVTDDVSAALKALPGFVSYTGGLNRAAGTLVAISTWQDEKAANFSREQLGGVLSRVVELAQLEAPEIYEVVITA